MAQVTRYVETIPASGRIDRSRGNFFLLFSSTVSLNVLMETEGTSEQINGVTGGVRVRRVTPWKALTIFGAAGGSVEFFFGADDVQEDEVDVFLQIATIAGVASIAESPSATFNSQADQSIAAAGSFDIAANLLRRRITIGSLSTNTDPVNLRVRDQTATTGEGIELQAGTFVELKTTAALRIRNNGAVAQTAWIVEES